MTEATDLKDVIQPVASNVGMDFGNDPAAGSPTATLLRLLLLLAAEY